MALWHFGGLEKDGFFWSFFIVGLLRCYEISLLRMPLQTTFNCQSYRKLISTLSLFFFTNSRRNRRILLEYSASTNQLHPSQRYVIDLWASKADFQISNESFKLEWDWWGRLWSWGDCAHSCYGGIQRWWVFSTISSTGMLTLTIQLLAHLKGKQSEFS